MNQYKINPSQSGTHYLIAEEIDKSNDILDVGCNDGYLKSIVDQSNNFYGIDYDENCLRIAKKNGYIFTAKVNMNVFEELIALNLKKKFDIIIFGDILEHLLEHEEILKFFVDNYLHQNGKIIVSLPNIAHITQRFNLAFGQFNYTEAGILDKTHLHFFTLKSARKFISSSGLKIICEKFSSNRFGWIVNLIPSLGGLIGYNIIIVGKKN